MTMLTLMPVCSQKFLMLIGTVISIFRSAMGVTTGRGLGGWTVGRSAGGGMRGFWCGGGRIGWAGGIMGRPEIGGRIGWAGAAGWAALATGLAWRFSLDSSTPVSRV